MPKLDIWQSGSYPYTLGAEQEQEVPSEPAPHQQVYAGGEPVRAIPVVVGESWPRYASPLCLDWSQRLGKDR